jgi:hypothetical protein
VLRPGGLDAGEDDHRAGMLIKALARACECE